MTAFEADQAVAVLARRQHGVFSRDQALAAGASRRDHRASPRLEGVAATRPGRLCPPEPPRYLAARVDGRGAGGARCRGGWTSGGGAARAGRLPPRTSRARRPGGCQRPQLARPPSAGRPTIDRPSWTGSPCSPCATPSSPSPAAPTTGAWSGRWTRRWPNVGSPSTAWPTVPWSSPVSVAPVSAAWWSWWPDEATTPSCRRPACSKGDLYRVLDRSGMPPYQRQAPAPVVAGRAGGRLARRRPRHHRGRRSAVAHPGGGLRARSSPGPAGPPPRSPHPAVHPRRTDVGSRRGRPHGAGRPRPVLHPRSPIPVGGTVDHRFGG